jgi:vacuolar-type H+-ATPase subunit H
MGPRRAPDRQPPEDDALARLLTAERSLAARLAAAREEAEIIVRQAREESQRIEEACAATIESRSAELAAQYETRIAGEIAAIERESSELASRFASVDETQLQSYVALVIERLLPRNAEEPNA